MPATKERIRRPDRVTGGITKAEKEKMRELLELWIERAYRTDPIERQPITEAILGIYRAAGLKEPRIVIVPSPRVMAFAGGFAAAIWYIRKNPNNPFATQRATYDATYDATARATHAATDACDQRPGKTSGEVLFVLLLPVDLDVPGRKHVGGVGMLPRSISRCSRAQVASA